MDLVRWEPFDGLTKMQSRINALFDEVFDKPNGHSQAYAGVWAPPVDILESRDSYLIRAELPGMKKDEISVEFKEGALTLSGEKKFEEPAEGVAITAQSGPRENSPAASICRKRLSRTASVQASAMVFWKFMFRKPTRPNRSRSPSA